MMTKGFYIRYNRGMRTPLGMACGVGATKEEAEMDMWNDVCRLLNAKLNANHRQKVNWYK